MHNIVRFDCFEVDLESRRLQKHGLPVKLRGQSFQVLASLLEHPGQVVTLEDLYRRLWGNEVFVDFDNNLNIAIARLRVVLGDAPEHPRFIETLPRYGYRFIADVYPVQSDIKPQARRVRLVVLPFLNLSGDAAEEYFSDAITDEVITAVAGVAPEHLAVIARTTAMHYKGSHKDMARIGRDLHVDYAVEGGVRRDGDQVDINVQLIQTSDQAHVFAKRYETTMRDVFDVYGSVAQAIASHIPGVAISFRDGQPGRELIRRKPTEDPVAYNLYLRGRHCMYEDFRTSKPYFEQALAHDAHFALAYDGLGEYYWWAGFFGLTPPKDAFSTGLWYALRALESDNTLAETHALLGQFRKELDYNWAEVQREMALALRLNPASPLVRFRRALSELMPLGRLDEARSELETVLDLDPIDLRARSWLGLMHLLARHYDSAIQQQQLVLQVDPNYSGAFASIGLVRCAEHKFAEAITALRKALELSNNAPVWFGWLGLALAQEGNCEEARGLLERLHKTAEHAYVPTSCFAWIHLGLGEIDEAFTWMNRALDERDPMLVPIKSYPHLDPIRSDPRFTDLLRKMNLEP